MFYSNRWRTLVGTALSALAVIFFGLAMFIPVAQADQPQPYDITVCGSATVTMLSASKELTVFIVESRSITRSNHTNKHFDNATAHCGYVVRVMNGKMTGNGYCKFMDPEGDITVGETTIDGAEGTWKFLQGTGKWKGIDGGGKHRAITQGKPITPGTTQSCRRATGEFGWGNLK
jgi:hypothetical protein